MRRRTHQIGTGHCLVTPRLQGLTLDLGFDAGFGRRGLDNAVHHDNAIRNIDPREFLDELGSQVPRCLPLQSRRFADAPRHRRGLEAIEITFGWELEDFGYGLAAETTNTEFAFRSATGRLTVAAQFLRRTEQPVLAPPSVACALSSTGCRAVPNPRQFRRSFRCGSRSGQSRTRASPWQFFAEVAFNASTAYTGPHSMGRILASEGREIRCPVS